MKNRVFVLGLNHKTAPLEIREQLAYTPDDMRFLIPCLDSECLMEALLLSTCNRTEIYGVGSQEGRQKVERFFEESRSISLKDYFYYLEEEKAVNHLFHVAAGLDSMILGETQIMNQIKKAFLKAQEIGTINTVLMKMVEKALVAGKKVRKETNLSEGALSVPYAAAELGKKILSNINEKALLLIGAGETGELAAGYFHDLGVSEFYIANRTYSKGETLARKLGGTSISLDKIYEILPQVDIVIGAAYIEQDKYLIDREKAIPIIYRPLLMLDLGVPRNFDPSLNELDSIFLYSLDDLEQVVRKNLDRRKKEIPKARKIITEEVEKFMGWRNTLATRTIAIELRKQFEELQKKELERFRHRFPQDLFEELERFSMGLLGKFLHKPLVQIKEYSRRGEFEKLHIIQELFGLENQKKGLKENLEELKEELKEDIRKS
ncbi:MAG: glutamyl-tRNA reductase [Planctomycetota bacterium]|nr:MAG: glutamyl-tRNA reductase [Planctomycetota bacterium]